MAHLTYSRDSKLSDEMNLFVSPVYIERSVLYYQLIVYRFHKKPYPI